MTRWVIVVLGVCTSIVLVLVAVGLLVPQDRGSTLRRVVDKARGEDWHRLATSTFSVDLPNKPVETPWPASSTHPTVGRTWRASSSGVLAALSVAPLADPAAPLDGRAEARKLLDGLAAEQGGKADDLQAVTVLGAVGLDATITGGDGASTRARAVVIAGVAHLFVVQGSRADFDRMTSSFRLSAS